MKITQNQGEMRTPSSTKPDTFVTQTTAYKGRLPNTARGSPEQQRSKPVQKHLQKAPSRSGLGESLQSRPTAGIPEGRVPWSNREPWAEHVQSGVRTCLWLLREWEGRVTGKQNQPSSQAIEFPGGQEGGEHGAERGSPQLQLSVD